nr:hypothetical protein [Pseudomonas sp. PS01300]
MSKPPEVLPHDHLVYAQAVEAMRKYHDAKDMGARPEAVECLRLIAEARFQAVTECQMRALGKDSRKPH